MAMQMMMATPESCVAMVDGNVVGLSFIVKVHGFVYVVLLSSLRQLPLVVLSCLVLVVSFSLPSLTTWSLVLLVSLVLSSSCQLFLVSLVIH